MLDIQLQCHTATRKMFIVSNLEEYRRSNLADRQKDDDDDDDGDDNNDDDHDDDIDDVPEPFAQSITCHLTHECTQSW